MNVFAKRLMRAMAGLVGMLVVAGAAQAAPVLALEPATSSHAAGESFDLRLVGQGLTDVYAFQFALDYTPGLLSAQGPSEGDALLSAGTTYFVAGAADDALGRLELSGNTLIGTIAGFSGDGWLASIRFAALAPGVAELRLTDLLLVDSALNILDAGSLNATVTITPGGSAVPLPSTLALVALGLSGVAGLRLRRGQRAA